MWDLMIHRKIVRKTQDNIRGKITHTIELGCAWKGEELGFLGRDIGTLVMSVVLKLCPGETTITSSVNQQI